MGGLPFVPIRQRKTAYSINGVLSLAGLIWRGTTVFSSPFFLQMTEKGIVASEESESFLRFKIVLKILLGLVLFLLFLSTLALSKISLAGVMTMTSKED